MQQIKINYFKKNLQYYFKREGLSVTSQEPGFMRTFFVNIPYHELALEGEVQFISDFKKKKKKDLAIVLYLMKFGIVGG